MRSNQFNEQRIHDKDFQCTYHQMFAQNIILQWYNRICMQKLIYFFCFFIVRCFLSLSQFYFVCFFLHSFIETQCHFYSNHNTTNMQHRTHTYSAQLHTYANYNFSIKMFLIAWPFHFKNRIKFLILLFKWHYYVFLCQCQILCVSHK